MSPANFSSLVINGLNHAFAPKAVISACPAISTVGRLGEVDAEAGVSIDDEQAGLGVEAGRTIVRHAAFVGGNEASVGSRFFVRIGNRTALVVNAQVPIHGTKRSSQ